MRSIVRSIIQWIKKKKKENIAYITEFFKDKTSLNSNAPDKITRGN